MVASETSPLLGNDVVDLRDPETPAANLHPRFDDRVFAARERARWSNAGASAHVLRWTHWALKEAAYKAVRRRDPHAVFSPSRIEVVDLDLPQGFATVEGFGRTFVGRLQRDGETVHAIVTSGLPPESVVAEVRRKSATPRDVSASVREFARSALARRIDCAGARLAVSRGGKIPLLLRDGRPLPRLLSLSHHGRAEAFACSRDLAEVAA